MSYLDRLREFEVSEGIARHLQSHGIDAEAATSVYVVIPDAQPWMRDLAHDLLDDYVASGRIDNYFFENPREQGLSYDANVLGILLDY